MTEESQNHVAAMFKWLVIIIALTMAYKNCAPNYYFMRNGHSFYRGNKVTGVVEALDENGWIDISKV
jgi:hypothetical protein